MLRAGIRPRKADSWWNFRGEHMSKYMVVDVGGTQIKGCLLEENGEPSGTDMIEIPAKAKESKDVILDNFRALFEALTAKSEDRVAKMAFSFPGEFAYPQGVSRLAGLDKYDALYGVSLRQEFRQIICENNLRNRYENPENIPILFQNDVEAFAMGAAETDKRAFALAIGTGAGSAFLENGKPVTEGTAGVPENGWIYACPFRGKRIDDWISKRGLMELSRERLGRSLDGAQMAELCRNGDKRAAEVYQEFGRMTAQAIEPFLRKFKPQECILGGQIMKSFPLFGEAPKELCRNLSIELKVVTETSRAAFAGLYKVLTEETEQT